MLPAKKIKIVCWNFRLQYSDVPSSLIQMKHVSTTLKVSVLTFFCAGSSESPVPPIAEEKTTPTPDQGVDLPTPFLTPDKDDSSSESSDSCRSSSRTSSPDLPSEDRPRAVSPTPSQPTTPASAMSISPANSEVGTRSIPRSSSHGGGVGGPAPPSASHKLNGATPKASRYAWPRRNNAGGRPDRADLDMNWRASASSGPASDRSSNSGGEREPARRHAAPLGGDRADRDSNWRDHDPAKPPAGPRTAGKKNGGAPETNGGEFSNPVSVSHHKTFPLHFGYLITIFSLSNIRDQT